MRRALWILLLALITTYCTPSAFAQYTYTYTGNHFVTAPSPYTTSDFVTVSFTIPYLPANLPLQSINPASFTINDGVHTFTNNDILSGQIFAVSTDSNANISNWGIWIPHAPNVVASEIGTENSADTVTDIGQAGLGQGQYAATAYVTNNPGQWVRTGMPGASITFLGGGSSALFMELGQAA